jgi:hypothetical protein
MALTHIYLHNSNFGDFALEGDTGKMNHAALRKKIKPALMAAVIAQLKKRFLRFAVKQLLSLSYE